MSNRLSTVVVATAFLLVASALGVLVIPRLGPIFVDMLPGQALPWSTRLVMSVGPVGFTTLAVFGAVLLVLTDSLRRARWIHGTLAIALAFALAFTIVALFRPIMRLLE